MKLVINLMLPKERYSMSPLISIEPAFGLSHSMFLMWGNLLFDSGS